MTEPSSSPALTDSGLRESVVAFLAKWPEVEKRINGMFGLQFARSGVQYDGPNIGTEIEAMRAALAQAGVGLRAPDLEICICAAIQLEDGRIIRGHRHDDCIQTALKWRAAGQDVKNGGLNAQGFVTSKNRYVDREEGMRLQVEAGLFKPRQGAQILMSEDLY